MNAFSLSALSLFIPVIIADVFFVKSIVEYANGVYPLGGAILISCLSYLLVFLNIAWSIQIVGLALWLDDTGYCLP